MPGSAQECKTGISKLAGFICGAEMRSTICMEGVFVVRVDKADCVYGIRIGDLC
jgi:hypothetical protein